MGTLEPLLVPAKPMITRTISDMPLVWNHFSGTAGPMWQKDNDTNAYPGTQKYHPNCCTRKQGGSGFRVAEAEAGMW